MRYTVEFRKLGVFTLENCSRIMKTIIFLFTTKNPRWMRCAYFDHSPLFPRTFNLNNLFNFRFVNTNQDVRFVEIESSSNNNAPIKEPNSNVYHDVIATTHTEKKCYPHSPKRSVTFKWVSRINYPIPLLFSWFVQWMDWMNNWLTTKTRKRKPIKFSRHSKSLITKFYSHSEQRSSWDFMDRVKSLIFGCLIFSLEYWFKLMREIDEWNSH